MLRVLLILITFALPTSVLAQLETVGEPEIIEPGQVALFHEGNPDVLLFDPGLGWEVKRYHAATSSVYPAESFCRSTGDYNFRAVNRLWVPNIFWGKSLHGKGCIRLTHDGWQLTTYQLVGTTSGVLAANVLPFLLGSVIFSFMLATKLGEYGLLTLNFTTPLAGLMALLVGLGDGLLVPFVSIAGLLSWLLIKPWPVERLLISLAYTICVGLTVFFLAFTPAEPASFTQAVTWLWVPTLLYLLQRLIVFIVECDRKKQDKALAKL